MVHRFDGVHSALLGRVGDEGATFALVVGVPEDGALLDGAELTEELPHIVLRALLGQHAHEQFPLWSDVWHLRLVVGGWRGDSGAEPVRLAGGGGRAVVRVDVGVVVGGAAGVLALHVHRQDRKSVV